MNSKIIKLFLRIAISSAFLSAVADRIGVWPATLSTWGNWENFLVTTTDMNPWFSESVIPIVAVLATGAEFIFALFILIRFKTELFAKLTGFLLLTFALSMILTSSIKYVFDYSVFSVSAAAFALSIMKEKYCELDLLIFKKKL